MNEHNGHLYGSMYAACHLFCMPWENLLISHEKNWSSQNCITIFESIGVQQTIFDIFVLADAWFK